MWFAQRIKLRQLAEFLRRMAMSLESGIDIRKTLANEIRRSSPAVRRRLEAILVNVGAGWSLSESMNATGEFFPSLVRQLIAVGEQTGHLPEVLQQLTEHYDQQIVLRRTFLSAIAWPMMQLFIALSIVGLLIWLMGAIEAIHNAHIDLLGLGLIGNRGLIIYLSFLGVVAAGIYLMVRAAAAGKLWVAPIQRLALRLPQIGKALHTLAVARFAWTLQMALDAAMEVRQSLSLALTSTRNIEFLDQRERILAVVQEGGAIHEALAETGTFPVEFLNAVQVGEESGRLVETLATVSRQQQEEARSALALLTRLAGYGVWMLVAALIIMLIFRLANFYIGTIQAMAGGR